MKATPENIRVVAEGLDHPEGLNFGPDGNLYAGGEAGQVYRIHPRSGKVEEYGRAEGFLILGVTLDGNGNLYGCHVGRSEVVKISPAGSVASFYRGVEGRELINPNYVFDDEGNCYYTDSGSYFEPNGCLYVVRPDGRTEMFHPGPLAFPNGLAIDAAGEYLYVVQSTGPDIVRLPLKSAGSGKPELYVRTPDIVPDGMAFDDRGRAVISCYVPDRLLLVDEDGEVDVLMDDPGAELLNRPTNVALGEGEIFFANLGGWHIGAFAFEINPMPLRYPRL
jgi:gluconolactonase